MIIITLLSIHALVALPDFMMPLRILPDLSQQEASRRRSVVSEASFRRERRARDDAPISR